MPPRHPLNPQYYRGGIEHEVDIHILTDAYRANVLMPLGDIINTLSSYVEVRKNGSSKALTFTPYISKYPSSGNKSQTPSGDQELLGKLYKVSLAVFLLNIANIQSLECPLLWHVMFNASELYET